MVRARHVRERTEGTHRSRPHLTLIDIVFLSWPKRPRKYARESMMKTTRTRAKARQGFVSWQQAQDKFMNVNGAVRSSRLSETPVKTCIQVPPKSLLSSVPSLPFLSPCLIHYPPLLDPPYSPPPPEILLARRLPVPQLVSLLLEATAQPHYPQAFKQRWLPYVSQVSPSVLAPSLQDRPNVDGKPGLPISRCRRCHCDIQAHQPRGSCFSLSLR